MSDPVPESRLPAGARLRRASWIVGAAAVVLPAAGAFLAMPTSYRAETGPGILPQDYCGIGTVVVLGIALLVAGAVSLVAVVLNIAAWRGQPASRKLARSGELVLLATPLILLALLVAQSPLVTRWF